MATCSPMIASGSGNVLGYVEEVCFGQVPVAVAMKVARRRSTTLGLTKEVYSSEEIRADRMIASSRHGPQSVGGDVVTEISPGGHADWYEALLGGQWVLPPISMTLVGAAHTTDEFNVTTITGLTISPVTREMQIGDIVKPTTTGSQYFDQKLFFLAGMSPATGVVTGITLVPLKTPTLVPPASPFATGTLLAEPRVSMGNIYRSYTFERAFADIGSYLTYSGCRMNTAAIDLPPTGIATNTFSVMGTRAAPLSATSVDGTAALVLTSGTFGPLNFSAVNGTATATTGDWVAAGVVVGDKLIFDGGGIAPQNRNAYTVIGVTALVLTLAEAVQAGTAGGASAWTATRMSAPAYTAAPTEDVLVSASGVLVYEGVPVGTVTAMTINIDNTMAGSNVVGSNFMPAILWGNQAIIGGTLTVLFDRGGAGELIYNAFQNEEDNISIMMGLVSADGLGAVGFSMNRCKINTGSIGDAVAEGLPVEVEFQALKPIELTDRNGTSAIKVLDTTVTTVIAPFAQTLGPVMGLAVGGSPAGAVPEPDTAFDANDADN